MEDIINLIEQGKIKRYFRARNKYSFGGAITHITQHAPGTEPLFLEDYDYIYMLYLMKIISRKHRFIILSFGLMLNHLHLLIKLESSNLSIAMQSLFQSYASYFNKKYDRRGHVFCNAFRSALCFDESYLLSSSIYIHLNPVRKRLAINPEDYKWSSATLFLDNAEKKTFIDYRFILSILDENIIRARSKYRSLLEIMKKKGIKSDLEQAKALELNAQILRKVIEGDNDKDSGTLIVLGDDEIEGKIRELRAKNRLRKPHDMKARRFLIEQLMARGLNVSEIATKLNVSRQLIHNVLR